ncbi:MAG: ABC transporter ATP-binding protein [Gammaproteobacteria bacterium]|jgi:putative ABC transport system ATP-binding protein|nr:ABC transporter [Chromatiales bacterium]MDP6450506.1 ABC transporter ATP-binding protein [Lentisphaeria bacterium]MDP6673582.1 ABC transporter ATP-binding protein [Gammaproteobacteria bacterium]
MTLENSKVHEVEPALRARDLTKVYKTGEVEVHALRGVSLELYPADMVALLGPSGSGKSTLLNILGGLDQASSGDAWFGSRHLTDLDDRALTQYRRAHVGFVFQFYNLIPSLTATENVALVTEISPDPMAAEDALEIVGLGERLHHFPAQLSGGEQQRVAIARAIAKRPELMLCDEPTGALDSQTGILVLEAIERIHAELNTTTVLITHNAVIADMTDRVLVMGDGHIVEEHRNTTKSRARDLHW